MAVIPRIASGLVALALVACGARPGLLESVEALDDDDRRRLGGFEVVLDADRLSMLVPETAPQRFDVRPDGLLRSGLDRYLPVLAPELVESMREFEERSGMRVLEIFERVTVWSSAADVSTMEDGRLEVLAAFDGRDFMGLVEWFEGQISARKGDGEPAEAEPQAPDDDYDGRMLMGIFCALDDPQRTRLDEMLGDDPQTVARHRLGPRTTLSMTRGTEDGRPWSMWAFVWPGGMLAERLPDLSLAEVEVALPRVATQLARVEGAARSALVPVPRDRVIAFSVRGSELPGAVDMELRMGDAVGLSFGMPASSLDDEMPTDQLLSAWPVMREIIANAAQQGLTDSELGDGFGPLLGRAIRLSTLVRRGEQLVWDTTLPRQDFEALLPTM